MGEKKRLIWLDALKGVGILSIMRVHMLAPMELLQSVIYVGAVSMFFVAAGFNFKPPQNALQAIKNKAKRLLIPYFVYSFLLLLIEHRLTKETIIQVIGIFYGRMALYQGIVEGNVSFLLIGNAPMWFLPCMFLSYVWVYMIYCRCKTAQAKYFVCLCFICLSALLYYSPLMLPWSIDTSFLFATLIVAGYELRQHFLHCKWPLVIMTLTLWLVLYRFFGGSNISVGSYGEYEALSIIPFTLIALSETYSLCGILKYGEKTWMVKALSYIGRHSLRLMCIHLVIYYKVISFFTTMGILPESHRLIVILTAFFVILAIDAIMDAFFLKIKDRMSLAKFL